MELSSLTQQLAGQQNKLPPVELWDPPFCGDIDISIKYDGTWFYQGTPIGRQAMVRLFASVLKREEDSYFLVTPVEKVRIRVEDSPFIVTQWQQQDEEALVFTTNIGDSFVVGEEHPIELMSDKVCGDVLPYALVRRNLWARLHQNVFYQLAEMGIEKTITGQKQLRLQSADYTFSLGDL